MNNNERPFVIPYAASAAHASDCAVNNMPAVPNGPCDCGASDAGANAGLTDEQIAGVWRGVLKSMQGMSTDDYIFSFARKVIAADRTQRVDSLSKNGWDMPLSELREWQEWINAQAAPFFGQSSSQAKAERCDSCEYTEGWEEGNKAAKAELSGFGWSAVLWSKERGSVMFASRPCSSESNAEGCAASWRKAYDPALFDVTVSPVFIKLPANSDAPTKEHP